MLIGLTGTFGSGKSTVAGMLEDLGAAAVDADAIAREVVAPGSEALEEIRRHFGDEILQPNGDLDRRKVAAIVFASAEKREVLNGIIHSRVIQEMDRRIEGIRQADPKRVIVLNVPLLFEAGLLHKVDKAVVVTISSQERIRRIGLRDGLTESEVTQRVQAQWTQEEKVARASVLIDNSGSLDTTRSQARRLYEQWQREAGGG
jgi:dephospho-CoA kinase